MSSIDTLNYIYVAELYANGQWSLAVNAFWSPAFSWLLAPFISAGVNGIVAVKVVNIAIGTLVLAALSSLADTLDLEEEWTALLLIAAVPFIASSVFLISTPDVLVVLVLTVYVRYLLLFNPTNQIQMGALVGILGFAGYLSKYYLFPFFLLHYTGMVVLRQIARSSKGPNWKGFAVGLAVFLIFSSCWILAIHAKYGVYTYSLTGPVARAMLSPSRGLQNPQIPIEIPRDRLTDPGVNSVHLPDPSQLVLPGGELTHMMDWSPFDGRRELEHQLGLAKIAFGYAGYWMVRFSPLLIPTLFVLIFFSLLRLRRESGFVLALLAWSPIALMSGYLTLSIEGRFILFVWIVGATGGLRLFHLLPPFPFKRLAVAIFLSTFAIMPARWLVVNMNVHGDLGRIAQELDSRFGVSGKIASTSSFMDTAQLNQHLGTKFLGTIEQQPTDQVLNELRSHGVNYFVVWQQDMNKGDWSRIGTEITNGSFTHLAVYRVE